MLYIDNPEGQIGCITMLLDGENIPTYEHQADDSGSVTVTSGRLNPVGRVFRLIQRNRDTQIRLDRLREAYDTLYHDYLDLKAKVNHL